MLEGPSGRWMWKVGTFALMPALKRVKARANVDRAVHRLSAANTLTHCDSILFLLLSGVVAKTDAGPEEVAPAWLEPHIRFFPKY